MALGGSFLGPDAADAAWPQRPEPFFSWHVPCKINFGESPMSNLIAIETPVALQPAQAVAPSKTAAMDIIAARGAGVSASNVAGDDVLLAAQGKLNNIRVIMDAISDSQAEDGELNGARAERAYFSYAPVADAKAANELIDLSKFQILNMPTALVAISQPPHAVLGLIR
jgi:hypothetical protein